MDFDFSPDQQQLKDQARRYLADQCSSQAVRAVLDGPQLPAGTEAALADTFSPPFIGTFIKPTPLAGNHTWRIMTPGRQSWWLGFVLPTAALAQDAFTNLRSIGPLPAERGRILAGTLFVLPSLFILIGLSWVYLTFGQVPWIAAIFF